MLVAIDIPFKEFVNDPKTDNALSEEQSIGEALLAEAHFEKTWGKRITWYPFIHVRSRDSKSFNAFVIRDRYQYYLRFPNNIIVCYDVDWDTKIATPAGWIFHKNIPMFVFRNTKDGSMFLSRHGLQPIEEFTPEIAS